MFCMQTIVQYAAMFDSKDSGQFLVLLQFLAVKHETTLHYNLDLDISQLLAASVL